MLPIPVPDPSGAVDAIRRSTAQPVPQPVLDAITDPLGGLSALTGGVLGDIGNTAADVLGNVTLALAGLALTVLGVRRLFAA